MVDFSFFVLRGLCEAAAIATAARIRRARGVATDGSAAAAWARLRQGNAKAGRRGAAVGAA